MLESSASTSPSPTGRSSETTFPKNWSPVASPSSTGTMHLRVPVWSVQPIIDMYRVHKKSHPESGGFLTMHASERESVMAFGRLACVRPTTTR